VNQSILAAALALTLLAPMAPTAQAAAIQLSDFGAHKVEVSFAGLPPAAGGVLQVVADGVTFEAGASLLLTYPPMAPYYGTPGLEVCAERGCIMTNADLGFISVVLPASVARVGALLGIPNSASSARAEFYAGASLLGTVDVASAAFLGEFAGWDAGADIITSVRFVDTVDQGFVLGLTALTYEATAAVTEPSTLLMWLIGLGAAAIGWRARPPAFKICGRP